MLIEALFGALFIGTMSPIVFPEGTEAVKNTVSSFS